MLRLLQATVINDQGIMVRDGKIYLVMTVVSIILIGLFAYVTNIDKKISKLEK